jgi:hypothetical protein
MRFGSIPNLGFVGVAAVVALNSHWFGLALYLQPHCVSETELAEMAQCLP